MFGTKEIFENLELFLNIKTNSIFLKDTLIIRIYICGYNVKNENVMYDTVTIYNNI